MAAPRRSFEPFAESLEPRVALATVALVGDALTITGTPGADRILIGPGRPGEVRVVVDGRDEGRFGPVASIEVDAGAGDDLVAAMHRLTVPVVIRGGPGDDILRGGSGPDQVFGEAGDDVLIGTRSRDALDSGPGSDRVLVPQKMGDLYVGRSAAGDGRRILGLAYTLRPLPLGADAPPGPMALGASDLSDPRVADLARRSYEAGHTISLTDGTAEDAAALHALLGHEGGIDWDPGVPRMDLISVRMSIRPDGGTNLATELVAPREEIPLPPGLALPGRTRADRATVEELSQTFASTPILPVQAPGDGGASNNLINLATSYQSRSLKTDTTGDSVQVTNNVWSARSFLNRVDLYYVLQEFDMGFGGYFPLKSWEGGVVSFQRPKGTSIIQDSPQSNQQATTETASVSYTAGGSLGWNQTQGVNASISGSVTITNSKTTTIPPVQIRNETDFANANAAWEYVVNQLSVQPEGLTFFDSWIWEVPFDSYGSLDTLPYSVNGNAIFNDSNNLVLPQINVFLPFPFGKVFSLQPPVITGLDPDYVELGKSFTIRGSGFYPSLVTDVLIGGSSVGADNYTTVSDTEITVIAPFYAPDDTVLVKTTEGTSNEDFAITIY